jgi:hypothetical protein
LCKLHKRTDIILWSNHFNLHQTELRFKPWRVHMIIILTPMNKMYRNKWFLYEFSFWWIRQLTRIRAFHLHIQATWVRSALPFNLINLKRTKQIWLPQCHLKWWYDRPHWVQSLSNSTHIPFPIVPEYRILAIRNENYERFVNIKRATTFCKGPGRFQGEEGLRIHIGIQSPLH